MKQSIRALSEGVVSEAELALQYQGMKRAVGISLKGEAVLHEAVLTVTLVYNPQITRKNASSASGGKL